MLDGLTGFCLSLALCALYLVWSNWSYAHTDCSVDAVKPTGIFLLKLPLIKRFIGCLSHCTCVGPDGKNVAFIRAKLVGRGASRAFCVNRYLCLVFVTFLLNACDSRTSSPVFTQQPRLISHPETLVPLSAIIDFESDQPVVARYTITAGDRTWQTYTRSSSVADQQSSFKRKHQQVLLRFLPDTEHRIDIQITNAQGQSSQFSRALVLQTPPLPQGFPTVEDHSTYGLYKAPGITLLSLMADDLVIERQPDKKATMQKTTEPAPAGWLIGLDDTASIVWYMPTDWRWQTIEQLPSGNLRLYSDLGSSLEIDMLGNKIRAWVAADDIAGQGYFQRQGLQPLRLEVEGMHHRRQLLPNGNSLVLTHEIEHRYIYFPNTQLKTGKTEPLLGDIIVELTPSGKTVRQWRLADLLDSSRRTPQTYTSTALFDSVAANPAAPVAWSGASGLVYDPKNGRIIVALRNQQALVGIDYSSGQLKWILADPRGWKSSWAERLLSVASGSAPESTTDKLIWPQNLGQPYLGQKGDIILLDQRAPSSESRILSYSVDEASMTFTQNHGYKVAAQSPARLQYIDSQQRILLSTAVNDASQYTSRLLHFPVDNIVGNTDDKPQSEHSLRLGSALIEDLIFIPQLLPPAYPVSQTHTALITKGPTVSEQDLAADRATIAAPITDKAVPLAEGDWRILVGPPGQQLQRILKIDQQRGASALGYLDQYPVMIMLKDGRMRFTYRSVGAEGSVSWTFHGSLSAGGYQVAGLLSLHDAAGQTLTAQIPWQGVKK